jgi:hypothetical protein
MSIVVFTGPTLPPPQARAELDALYLPPAAQGDVYRAALARPVAIGVIDGFFENVPAVWHKEILYALSEGVHVYGSASMGALRAAELSVFGMEGVGAIFEAYRDGRLEDDDEVTIVHAPAEIGYLPLSEAMVDIRRTLSDALAEGVIGERTRARLESTAKSLPYRDRNYATILENATVGGGDPAAMDLQRLISWLPVGRASQKTEDALLMLRTMRSRFRRPNGPKNVRFHFEHTTLWDRAIRSVEPQPPVTRPLPGVRS